MDILITIGVAILGLLALVAGFAVFYMGVAGFSILWICGPQSAKSLKDIATLGPIKRKQEVENLTSRRSELGE